jgi:hypothetical protein
MFNRVSSIIFCVEWMLSVPFILGVESQDSLYGLYRVSNFSRTPTYLLITVHKWNSANLCLLKVLTNERRG